ncbi:MAG: hypothetical protein CLLPBCKN_002215 [Chroococcidiopsis cubana SAG 39.79]|nr:hypothetical protein [Chroococcidiopsis cubana SAG 39.79]
MRLILMTGKGGVGKTCKRLLDCAAPTSLQAS